MTNTITYGDIGWAINHTRHGHKMRRKAWRDATLWIACVPEGAAQVPQKFASGHTVRQHIVMHNVDDTIGPYTCNQADLLAHDWEMVDAPQPGHSKVSDVVTG
jgi:hypothetical protein